MDAGNRPPGSVGKIFGLCVTGHLNSIFLPGSISPSASCTLSLIFSPSAPSSLPVCSISLPTSFTPLAAFLSSRATVLAAFSNAFFSSQVLRRLFLRFLRFLSLCFLSLSGSGIFTALVCDHQSNKEYLFPPT